MPSLIGTNVTVNYLKTKPSTMFGTRDLVFLEISFKNENSYDIDLTKAFARTTGFAGTFLNADSYLSRVIRTVQEFAEIYAVGRPAKASVVNDAFEIIIGELPDTDDLEAVPFSDVAIVDEPPVEEDVLSAPDASLLTIAVASTTLNSSTANNVQGGYGLLEAELKKAVGNGFKAADNTIGSYDGTVIVKPRMLFGNILK